MELHSVDLAALMMLKKFFERPKNTPNNPFYATTLPILLIDKNKNSKRQNFRKFTLKKDPDYEDAQSNYNRLNFQQNLAKNQPLNKSSHLL